MTGQEFVEMVRTVSLKVRSTDTHEWREVHLAEGEAIVELLWAIEGYWVATKNAWRLRVLQAQIENPGGFLVRSCTNSQDEAAKKVNEWGIFAEEASKWTSAARAEVWARELESDGDRDAHNAREEADELWSELGVW